ncbi:MAG TPA: methyltransferase [Chloroflexia bacterium]|nr:methyltransferase [Chloroflexia bacterium]
MTQVEEAAPATHELPPPLVLLNMLSGMMSARALQAAAKFGIADLLKDGPKGVAELAEITGTHTQSLYRLLRALTSCGVFSEIEPQVFSNNPLSSFLQSDVHGSMRNMTRMWGDDWRWASWGELAYSIQTGRPAFNRIYGKNLWQYFEENNPSSGRLFSQAMTSFSESVNGPVVASYDFSGIDTLVDVGGAHGSSLSAILKAFPSLNGVLFDIPAVIEGAKEPLQAQGVLERCRLVAGDFFESVPAGADAYIMKFILHDWDDEHCLQILRNCRKAIQPGGRLLVVEQLIPAGNEPAFSKILDLEMLAILVGRERTAAEFEQLFEESSFRLSRVIPAPADFSIIEGIAI